MRCRLLSFNRGRRVLVRQWKLAFLIGVFVCFVIIQYKVYNKKVVEEDPTASLFVIRAFSYSQSRSFDGDDAVVVLYNRPRFQRHLPHKCQRQLTDGSTQTVFGSVDQLVYGPSVCPLTLYRLVCRFAPVAPVLHHPTISFSVPNPEEQAVILPTTPGDSTKRGVVACMSRAIAFDNWPVLVLGLEAFRALGGSLSVVYVECMLQKVFDLLEVYERDGLATIRHGYEAPRLLEYDPNAMVEYSNQMSTAHECLYEFKEFSEFIAFLDWDEILVTMKSGENALLETLRGFGRQQPMAAVISVPRCDTTLNKPFTETDPYDLRALVPRLNASNALIDPKMVAVPYRAAGVWIHSMKQAEKDVYKQMDVDASKLVILHVGGLLPDNITTTHRTLEAYEELPIDKTVKQVLNGSRMQENLENMLRRQESDLNVKNFPHNRVFFKPVAECYNKIDALVQLGNISYCPSVRACKFESQNVSVTRIQTTHAPAQVTGPLTVYHRESVSFAASHNGCL